MKQNAYGTLAASSARLESEVLADCELFDKKFTVGALQRRLQEHFNCFSQDRIGGLRCGSCNVPAVYRTVHLSIRVNGADIGMVSTRSIPVCRKCHGWEDQAAHLCLTEEEALARGLIPAEQNLELAAPEL